MKEDHMLNGQLKPGYNWQISTENQYILGYTIHQNPTDTTTLPSHMKSLKETLGRMPDVLVADAGYGSEENYQYLERNGVEAFVKYNYFHAEQGKKFKSDPFKAENLQYDADNDCYICPSGGKISFIREETQKTDNGFIQTRRIYRAQNCEECPLRSQCHKQRGHRIIGVNHNLNRYKSTIRERLNSERGKKYRSQRPVDVEAVFGIIKGNRNYRKFLLRGLDKVEIEAGLLALSHNLGKLASKN
jgi:hypothetical protein